MQTRVWVEVRNHQPRLSRRFGRLFLPWTKFNQEEICGTFQDLSKDWSKEETQIQLALASYMYPVLHSAPARPF